MMTFHGLRAGRLARLNHGPASGLPSPADVLWIDLFDPSREEEQAVETMLGLLVPTRQEMAEIEDSARLYEERGALVMTAVVINGVTEGRPARAQVTFVLTQTHLVSLRYADPVPFRTFEAKCQRQPEAHTSSDRVFVSLLESIVERAADVLELVAADLSEVSTTLFFEEQPRRANLLKERLPAGLTPSQLAQLAQGEDLVDAAGAVVVRHADVAGPIPTPRRYAFCSDTRHVPGLAALVRGADLLYHEATFLDESRERAAQTFHSTARQAAELAQAAGVRHLLLGHFSSRYKALEPLLTEARAVFERTDLAVEGLAVQL